ncbi:hypothetical protein SCUCBS95973_005553 [Sporothrix curviconia]|uniref:Integral membrane protein n=1 Tax=Sporothrix curviconia TaxID=1260050 RepID=A0ABP0BY71_9PEZI
MPFSIANALSALVGVEHVCFLVLEMFLWTTPRGRKTFKLTPEFAQQSRPLAANIGLYNGFLATGMFWGLAHPDPAFGRQIRLFFQGCITVAGVFGGATSSKRILYVQAIPAAAALAATLLRI